MRVIAGKARRLPLKTVEGMDTRPTTDRIKETLFNMIQNDLYGISFLDLFAGSGGIGIEALSRGAGDCVFVDRSKEACRVIRANLAFTHLEGPGALVMECDYNMALERLSRTGRKFDMVFLDPPYHKEIEKAALERIAKLDIFNEDAVIIIEADLETEFDYLEDLGYELIRVKTYKTNQHVFVQKKPEEA